MSPWNKTRAICNTPDKSRETFRYLGRGYYAAVRAEVRRETRAVHLTAEFHIYYHKRALIML